MGQRVIKRATTEIAKMIIIKEKIENTCVTCVYAKPLKRQNNNLFIGCNANKCRQADNKTGGVKNARADVIY